MTEAIRAADTIPLKDWIQDVSRNFVNYGKRVGDKNLVVIGAIIPEVVVVEGEGPLEVMFDRSLGRFKLINLPREVPRAPPKEEREFFLAAYLGAIAQGFSMDPLIVEKDPVLGSLAVSLRATSTMSKIFGPVGKHFTTPRIFGFPDDLSVSKYYELLKVEGGARVMVVDLNGLFGGRDPWTGIDQGGERQGRTAFIPARVRIKC